VHDAAADLPAASGVLTPAVDHGSETATMPTTTAPAGASAAATSPGEQFALPEVIGRYCVVGVLDAGGQALVYRAVHPTLPRDVAIKIAHEPSSIDRSLLKGDAELLCLLEHPNLVRVHDLDLHDGRPFVVMEFVRGRNLQQVAAQALPSPYQTARWMAVIARAVAYVHRCGVVHQDIKPKNILIDESGRPRLIDFGVARWRNVWSEGQVGPSGGTLSYMAPEQARGESEQVGGPADIFGMGATLYFLLTAGAPFEGKSKSEQWRRASRCEFDRVALRGKKVPRALERIVVKAMAADPKNRFESAEDMAKALDGFIHRPRRLAIQAGALLLLAMAMVGWWLWPHQAGPSVAGASAPNIAAPEPTPPQPKPASPPANPASTLPLRIESLQIALYPRTEGDPTGLIGINAFAGRFGQDVRVKVRLTVPAYCYLVALNPDGELQRCYPENTGVRPPRASTIDYPSDPKQGFSLTDGTGTQAFVVIASLDSLPSYEQWLQKTGDLPWKRSETATIWRYDGKSFDSNNPERGAVRQLADLPLPFAETCRALRSAAHVDAIQAVAFPVKAAGESPALKRPG
jgi:serine/threonine protein kinase